MDSITNSNSALPDPQHLAGAVGSSHLPKDEGVSGGPSHHRLQQAKRKSSSHRKVHRDSRKKVQSGVRRQQQIDRVDVVEPSGAAGHVSRASRVAEKSLGSRAQSSKGGAAGESVRGNDDSATHHNISYERD